MTNTSIIFSLFVLQPLCCTAREELRVSPGDSIEMIHGFGDISQHGIQLLSSPLFIISALKIRFIKYHREMTTKPWQSKWVGFSIIQYLYTVFLSGISKVKGEQVLPLSTATSQTSLQRLHKHCYHLTSFSALLCHHLGGNTCVT